MDFFFFLLIALDLFNFSLFFIFYILKIYKSS